MSEQREETDLRVIATALQGIDAKLGDMVELQKRYTMDGIKDLAGVGRETQDRLDALEQASAMMMNAVNEYSCQVVDLLGQKPKPASDVPSQGG